MSSTGFDMQDCQQKEVKNEIKLHIQIRLYELKGLVKVVNERWTKINRNTQFRTFDDKSNTLLGICLVFAIVYHFICSQDLAKSLLTRLLILSGLLVLSPSDYCSRCRHQKCQQKLSEDGKYDLFSRSIKTIDFTYFKDSRKKWPLNDALDTPIRPTLLRTNYFQVRDSVLNCRW
jgi:hypothetical protein